MHGCVVKPRHSRAYDRRLCSLRPVPATPSPMIPPFAGQADASATPPAAPDGAPDGPARAWQTPVGGLPGVRPALAEKAHSLGLATVGDLLTHIPSRYEHYDEAQNVADVVTGQEATVRVELASIRVVPTRRRKLVVVRASVFDATGRLEAVWFNQRHLLRLLTPGDTLMLRGVVEAGAPRQMKVKAHEVLGSGRSAGLHTQGLVPVYPASEALPTARIRELVDLARPWARFAPEALPTAVRHEHGLMSAADATVGIHFPRSQGEADQARRRLVVEEFLVLVTGLMAIRQAEAAEQRGLALAPTGAIGEPVRGALAFRLTADQERALEEISADMASGRPMRRLIQGEVGSGKTLVAVLAMCQAVEAGAQAAILVPTETLAEQHLGTLDRLLGPLGRMDLMPVLLTGKVPAAERRRRLTDLAGGTRRIAIGTQALLSEGVDFHELGLVVVDEQHRFGVHQRHALSERARSSGGRSAHILYMTATPIPRTLALTAFGDLVVSTIHGRPHGTGQTVTRWLTGDDRDEAYAEIRAQVRDGRQAYVICPLVNEGESESKAATAEYEMLRAGPLASVRLGLVHGAMKADEKRAAMDDFAAGRTDVLVATTVVEVGIDVPNATVMLIEGAERFGLAQLHQLRGRVGRGGHPGLCLVVADELTDEGQRRLEAFTQTNDGFRLAELDLRLRGEGAVLGLRQSGMTDLRYARLARDTDELELAARVAAGLLCDDPHLQHPAHGPLRAAVRRRFADIPRLLHA